MSTTDRTSGSDQENLEAIYNKKDGTVTFSPTSPEDTTIPATEWITVAVDDVVDVQEQR